MKSPRRITVTGQAAVEHDLSTAPPPPGALFWTLCNGCTRIAQQALETPFIQGIGAGTLDPVRYGAFNVCDAYYCYSGAADYAAAAARTSDPGLRTFLLFKYHAYQQYNATFPTVWHIKDASGIVPLPVCRDYRDFEREVVLREDPVYTLVAMLPCEYLWAWLAAQLGSPQPQNLYGAWITGNDDFDGAYAIGNYLATFQAAYPGALDPGKAAHIFTRAMTFEQRNFAAATNDA